jgi:hypothetical protein
VIATTSLGVHIDTQQEEHESITSVVFGAAGGNAPTTIAAEVVPVDYLGRFSFADVMRILDGTALVSSNVLIAPGKKIIVIISSTFTDTMNE